MLVQYGWEKLVECGDVERVCDVMVVYYVGFVVGFVLVFFGDG